MKRFLLRWTLLVVALIVSATLTGSLNLPFSADYSSVGSVIKLFIGVAVLSVLNATLGTLLKLLTLPLNCMTLGMVSLIINAVMLQIAGSLDFGFKVESFLAALIGSIIFSIVNAILGTLIRSEEND